MAAKSYMRVENVVKKFGPFTAVDGVDLDIAPGEVHALLGDNVLIHATECRCFECVKHPLRFPLPRPEFGGQTSFESLIHTINSAAQPLGP